jgi:hypothetical protein
MSQQSFIAPRTLVAIVASAAIAFALSLLLTLQGGGPGAETVGANSFSRSAIGCRGFYELLQKLGYRVSRGYDVKPASLPAGAILVLAEPLADAKTKAALARLKTAPTVLLALPKRRGRPDYAHTGWIEGAATIPLAEARATLASVAAGEVVRIGAPAPYDRNIIGHAPSIAAETQLIKSSDVEPLVASKDGILLGEIRDGKRRLLILSDPDVIENQGLDRGDNASFLVGLMQLLGAQGAHVVFSEAIHGEISQPAAPPPDLLKLITHFPFWLAPAQLLILLALLLAATMGRFGAPQPAPAPLTPGKRGLIANTARLLDFGGHRTAVLRRYVEITIKDTAQRLKAPRQLSDAALVDWLQKPGRTRGVNRDCAAILEDARRAIKSDRHAPLSAARAIHVWKTEILDGHSGHWRDHRGHIG